MAQIRFSIRSNTRDHEGSITVENSKEMHAFLRIVAMLKCAESGIYKIDSLEGVPEALLQSVDDMQRQRDLALQDRDRALIEAANAKINSDAGQIERLQRQVQEKDDEIRRLTVLANMRNRNPMPVQSQVMAAPLEDRIANATYAGAGTRINQPQNTPTTKPQGYVRDPNVPTLEID